MRKKVDCGKIIDEINFDIEKFDTIETLKFKTFLYCKEKFSFNSIEILFNSFLFKY